MDYKTFQGLTEGRFLKSLYHMTHSAATILAQNALRGSALAAGEQLVVAAATKIRDDEDFYISFARTNSGNYTRVHGNNYEGIRTVFQCDKNKLAKYGRIVPIDFFQYSPGKGGEAEDRLLIGKGKSHIPILSVISAIHVYDPNEARKEVIRKKIADYKNILRATDEYNVGRIDEINRWIDRYTKELERFEKVGYSGDVNTTAANSLKNILEEVNGTGIPVYVYASAADFNATRFSHAAQMNTALDDEDDDDEDL